MQNKRIFAFISLVILLFAVIPADWSPPHRIREFPTNRIPDIAMATFDMMGPVIYYNPVITNLVGPNITMFTRAHEYGHHYLGHLKKAMFASNFFQRVRLQNEFEKQADLFAVEQLFQSGDIDAIIDTIQFFRSKGYVKYSVMHPAGAVRAAYMEVKLNELRTDEPSPVQEDVTFTVEIPRIRFGELGGTITIYIDGKRIGKISNFDDSEDTEIDISDFSEGTHDYKLRVRVYGFQGMNPVYMRSLSGSGTIYIEDYDTFVVSNGAINPRLIKL